MSSAADRAMARIARGGGANLAGAGISAASGLIVVLVVTRSYPLADAGALFACMSVFLIVQATVQLGADQGFVRFVAWLRARGQHGDVRPVLRSGFVAAAAAAVLTAAMVAALAGPVADAIGGGHGSANAASVLRVLCCAVPIAAAYELTLGATRGFGTMRPTVVIERLLRPLLQIGLVTIAALSGAGIALLAAAWAAPYVVGLAAAIRALRRCLRADAAESPSAVMRPNEVRGEFWRFTLARGMAKIGQVGLQRLDVVLVAALRGPRDAAIYTAITRFLVVGQLALHAVQQVVQPRLAEMLAVGDRTSAALVLRRTTVWFVALTWPLYLTIAVHAAPLVTLFGAEYRPGAISLALLCAAMLVATAAGPIDVVLAMAGRSGLSLANTMAALGVNVALCFLLVPGHGVLGAALAWASAIFTRNALGVWHVYTQLHMTAASGILGRVAIAAAVAFGAVPLAAALAGAGTLWTVLAFAVGAAGYLVFLWRHRDSLGLAAFAALSARIGRTRVLSA